MIVQRFVCDRCNNEILTDNVFTVAIEEKPKARLDDLGDFEDSLSDAHFCADCKNKILAYIFKREEENAVIEQITEPQTAEVVQESAPKRRRATRDSVVQDRQIAKGLYAAGKPIGEIARSLGHTYQCIKNWVL